MTRALRHRYLSIDSLCIVQDDSHDWEKESARMASVYSDALLTIAATRSADGDGGLFFSSHEIEVIGITPLDEPYRLIFRQPVQHQIGLEPEPTRSLHPLFDRAWVFQERILSPRILHFGVYELFLRMQLRFMV